MLLTAATTSSPVSSEKPVMVITPILSFTSQRTGFRSMTARVMETSNGPSRPAKNGQFDRCARLAAHAVNRLVQCAADDQLAVEMRDIVARLDSGLVGGGVDGGGDHFDRAILQRHGQPESAIFAVNLCLQALEVAFVEKGAVRIERVEHALDRASISCLSSTLST